MNTEGWGDRWAAPLGVHVTVVIHWHYHAETLVFHRGAKIWEGVDGIECSLHLFGSRVVN